MQSKRRQKRHWKIWGFCWCMMISLGQAQGQSFAEALQAGQTIKVEWIQQELREKNGKRSRSIPLFPDELQPGESEIRVGLHLKSLEGGRRLVAEVAYVNYLAIPVLEENPYSSSTENLLSQPIILDTRFQDQYFDPQLFLLDAAIPANTARFLSVRILSAVFNSVCPGSGAIQCCYHLAQGTIGLAARDLPPILFVSILYSCILLPVIGRACSDSRKAPSGFNPAN